jgi:hypothetical protein
MCLGTLRANNSPIAKPRQAMLRILDKAIIEIAVVECLAGANVTETIISSGH